MRRFVTILLLVLACVGVPAAPVDRADTVVALSVSPTLTIPLPTVPNYFNMGGGVSISADLPMPFLPALSVRASGDYALFPIWTGGVTNIFRAGGGLSLALGTFAERITPEVFGGAGYYYGVIADDSAGSGGNAFFTGGLRVGWSFGPRFDQGIEARYEAALDGMGGLLYHGISVSTSTRVSLLRQRELEIRELLFEQVFPVLYKRYTTDGFGTVTLHNASSQAMENLKVTIQVENYMDAPWECPAPERLDGGESADVNLVALFSENAVLAVTEATVVSATVSATYSQGDREFLVERSAPLRILDRHAMTWDDDQKPAAYVTYKDPVLVDIASTVARVANQYPGAVDKNLRIGMALHEAFREYQLTYRIDPATPFIEFSESVDAIDYLQFPRNTLQRRAGDCDDLSILYAAALQAAGVEAAFVTIPGHIYAAFALNVGPEDARRLISEPDNLIVHDGRAWVPVEITMTDSSFQDAWRAGAAEWNSNAAVGAAAIYPLYDAWTLYEPVGQVGEFSSAEFVSDDVIATVFGAELDQFIDREIFAQAGRLLDRVSAGQASPQTLNRVGAVYARYGKYEEAREYFLAATEDEQYVPGLINLAATSMVLEDLDAAFEYLTAAEELDPDNLTVLIQLARVYNRRGDFSNTAEYYDRVARADEGLAARYSHLDTAATPAARAAGRQELWEVMPWVDE